MIPRKLQHSPRWLIARLGNEISSCWGDELAIAAKGIRKFTLDAYGWGSSAAAIELPPLGSPRDHWHNDLNGRGGREQERERGMHRGTIEVADTQSEAAAHGVADAAAVLIETRPKPDSLKPTIISFEQRKTKEKQNLKNCQQDLKLF